MEPPLSECCTSKEVGGVSYILVGEMDTTGYNCLDHCVYMKDTGAADEKVRRDISRGCFGQLLTILCKVLNYGRAVLFRRGLAGSGVHGDRGGGAG